MHPVLGYGLAAVLLVASPARAAPYVPASDAEVVERLPHRLDPRQRELARLRAALAARPQDLRLAVHTARRYLELARSLSDPRYLGYAQAALAPWWQLAAPPAEIRLLRATLRQSMHQFERALADLDAVLASDPGHAQAWLIRATVLTVRGDYAAARDSCTRLKALTTELVHAACQAQVASMTGALVSCETALELAARRDTAGPLGVRVWALTLLGELAARRGNPRLAEARFREALAMDENDSYLIGAFADLLLDQRRPHEALSLVAPHTRADGLLLRHALALQQQGSDTGALDLAVAELNARFVAAERRGDKLHQREQARFELSLRSNRRAALQLARLNWAQQKEIADMRVLLEAAVALNDPAAAAPGLDWLRTHGTEDVALARLARQLDGRR